MLSGRHTEAGGLRRLKPRQRQWLELETGKRIIKAELSKERADGSVHKRVIRNITYISLGPFFVILGRGASDP